MCPCLLFRVTPSFPHTTLSEAAECEVRLKKRRKKERKKERKEATFVGSAGLGGVLEGKEIAEADGGLRVGHIKRNLTKRKRKN